MPLTLEQKKAREEWKREEKLKREQARLDAIVKAAVVGDGVYSGPTDAEEEIIKTDWQKLQNLASLKFPVHLADKFMLTPQQRCICIAWCTGWDQVKIATAANLNKSTVWRVLNENETAKEFIKAFNYHNNPTDIKEVIDKEQYNSLVILKDLRDDPSVSATTRADIAKWFWETKHGKAKETKEVRGVDIKTLTKELSDSRSLLDSVEDEDKAN